MERLFIGGLSLTVNEAEVKERLSRYGAVSRIHMPPGLTPKEHRGIAFVDIEYTSPSERGKLFSVFNSSVWKGRKVSIQAAQKGPYDEKGLSREITTLKTEKKRHRPLIRHSDQGIDCLVNEKNVDSKKREWWYRGKYGRPVAVMRMRTGPYARSIMTIDPSHFKDRYEKLFGSCKPKPYGQLSWEYNEVVDLTDSAGASLDVRSEDEDVKTIENETEECNQITTIEIAKQTNIVSEEEPIPKEKKRNENFLKLLHPDIKQITPLGLFYRDKPIDQVKVEWLRGRSDFKQDYKRRIKQSKRLLRRSQKLS